MAYFVRGLGREGGNFSMWWWVSGHSWGVGMGEDGSNGLCFCRPNVFLMDVLLALRTVYGDSAGGNQRQRLEALLW
jgi:hypothetical protein